MAKSFKRYDLFSCELGLENDDYDDNNDKKVDIKIGSLDDFEVLVFFGISENAFKEHNGRIDGRFIACLWLRPAVYSINYLYVAKPLIKEILSSCCGWRFSRLQGRKNFHSHR